MASRTELITFNRGLISPLGLARKDLERTGLSAETFTNWMPRNLGSMMLRPGTSYIGNTDSNNQARFIPFVYASDDKALLELTNNNMRIWSSDALISRPSVSTTVINGDMSQTPLETYGWTDDDEAGGVSGPTGGYMYLEGDGSDAAIRTQEVVVAAVDQGTEHGLYIEVGRLDITQTHITGSPVTLRVGSTDGDDDYISEIQLGNGNHHIVFTPTTNIWIQLSNREDNRAYVRTCEIDSSGTLNIGTLWTTSDLQSVRYDQSADVIYIACAGVPPCKIQRYDSASKSWGVVLYEPQQGPLNAINTGPITLTPGGLGGSVGLVTAPAGTPLFKTTDVGRLIRIDSDGQSVTRSGINADDTWTNEIKVTGAGNERVFTITISGTWTTTASLQRSLTDPDVSASWTEVTTYTTNGTRTYDDSLDNQDAWYRIGFDTGWDSGSATMTLDYPNGSITGYARIYGYLAANQVNITTIQDFGSTDTQKNWYLGAWSYNSGYPSTVAFAEGRLVWFGLNKAWFSESDNYEGFDIETEGDSATFQRTIGSGSVDSINWALGLRRVLMGTDTREHVIRSSSEDEPLTPTNATLKDFGTQGSANVIAMKNDKAGLFVQRGGIRLMEVIFGGDYEYQTQDLTIFNPMIGSPGITHIAIQKQPDTRVHCVRSDGTVAVLLHDNTENISCWIEIEASGTDAEIEDVVVMPGDDGSGEDDVYYSVKRTVDGSTVRFLEKWSLESECQGGTLNKQMDAHITGTVTNGLLTGLSHLEGETLAVWVNGVDAGTYTVSGGNISGVTSDGSAVAGLSYTAQWQSAKLGELTQRKNISDLSVILYNTHYQGLKYGPDFTNLDDLPQTKDGAVIAEDTIHTDLDQPSFSFDGHWDSDARLCLQAQSPRPCTLLAAVLDLEG